MRVTEEQYSKLARGEKITPTEHAEQVEFFKFWRRFAAVHNLPAQLCFAIHNASKLTDGGRIWKYAEGLVAGVSDIFLAIPRDQFHGLFIEMKRRPNSVSVAQADFQGAVTVQGYLAVTSYTCEDAIREVKDYLGV